MKESILKIRTNGRETVAAFLCPRLFPQLLLMANRVIMKVGIVKARADKNGGEGLTIMMMEMVCFLDLFVGLLSSFAKPVNGAPSFCFSLATRLME